jgi:HrpA-like RNA helicase
VVDEVIGFADIHIHEPEGDVLIFMTGQVSIFMIRHLLYNKM